MSFAVDQQVEQKPVERIITGSNLRGGNERRYVELTREKSYFKDSKIGEKFNGKVIRKPKGYGSFKFGEPHLELIFASSLRNSFFERVLLMLM